MVLASKSDCFGHAWQRFQTQESSQCMCVKERLLQVQDLTVLNAAGKRRPVYKACDARVW